MKFIASLFLIAQLVQGLSSESKGFDAAAVRFFPVEVWGDSGGYPLAAFQLVLTTQSEDVVTTGIEGGSHPAFVEPPTYDPRAMQGNRLIVAQFSLESADRLPTGETRLFTVHVQASRGSEPVFDLKVIAAGNPDGVRIPLRCKLVQPSVVESL